jgi:hypothetical protein
MVLYNTTGYNDLSHCIFYTNSSWYVVIELGFFSNISKSISLESAEAQLKYI